MSCSPSTDIYCIRDVWSYIVVYFLKYPFIDLLSINLSNPFLNLLIQPPRSTNFRSSISKYSLICYKPIYQSCEVSPASVLWDLLNNSSYFTFTFVILKYFSPQSLQTEDSVVHVRQLLLNFCLVSLISLCPSLKSHLKKQELAIFFCGAIFFIFFVSCSALVKA